MNDWAEAPRQHRLRWLIRVSDDMWGAVQLLGLFFLGATILCVPPRFNPSNSTPAVTGAPAAAEPVHRAAADAAAAPGFTPIVVQLAALPERRGPAIAAATFVQAQPAVDAAR